MPVRTCNNSPSFQAGIEDTVALVEATVGNKSGGGVKNQIEFLTREKFISDCEQQSLEAGRIGLVFGLEFTQVLLIKATNLD